MGGEKNNQGGFIWNDSSQRSIRKTFDLAIGRREGPKWSEYEKGQGIGVVK